MAVISRCCCWKNVRSGSFAAGFYTLILYVVVVTGGAFNLDTVMESPSSLALSLTMIACSVCCVVTSILLLIGLSVDSEMLLIPWLISVFITTSADFIFSLYLLLLEFNQFLVSLFVIDVLICSLNIYCLVCVYSQYQEYTLSGVNPTPRTSEEIEYKGANHSLATIIKPLSDIPPLTNGASFQPSISHLDINEFSKVLSQKPNPHQNSEEISTNIDSKDAYQLIVHHVPENAQQFESKISVSTSVQNKSLLW